MNFSEHYLVEADDGAALTQFVKDAIGGKALDQHRLTLDDPSNDRKDRKDRASRDGRDGRDGDTSDEPTQVDPDEPTQVDPDEPKKPKPMPLTKKHRSVGYISTEGHTVFNSLVSDIVKSETFKDDIISVKPVNTAKFTGYAIEFTAQGEDPIAPQYSRLIYLLKNKDGKSPTDWSAIGFRGILSFEDAIELFFLGHIKNKNNIYKLLKNVKWDQSPPRTVNDPSVFASWSKQQQPAEDLEFTNKVISKAVGDKRSEINSSFSLHYDCDMLIEACQEPLEETIIDDMINNTFKGIGGGIKTLLKRPAIIRLSNPSKLLEYFPKGNTFQVQKGAYAALNMLGGKSYGQWMETKKEYGVVAQQFIKMKSVYVRKVYDVEVKTPKNEKQQEAFEQGVAKIVDNFDIDTEQYDFTIEDVKVYDLTNGGAASTMMISIVDAQQEQLDQEQPVGEAEDMSNVDNDNVKFLFFIGVDSKGHEFFRTTLKSDVKKFIQNNNSSSAVKATSKLMDDSHGSFIKSSMGNFNKFLKRGDIDNAEFNKILKAFKSSNKYTSGPTKSNKGSMVINTFEVKDGKGKVLFINDGKGTNGRILVTPQAKDDFESSGADATNWSEYKETSKTQETPN